MRTLEHPACQGTGHNNGAPIDPQRFTGASGSVWWAGETLGHARQELLQQLPALSHEHVPHELISCSVMTSSTQSPAAVCCEHGESACRRNRLTPSKRTWPHPRCTHLCVAAFMYQRSATDPDTLLHLQDSLCLAQLMLDISPVLDLQLVVAHCDHSMRPDSAACAEYVRQWAADRGLEHHVAVADVALRSEVGLHLMPSSKRLLHRCCAEVHACRVCASQVRHHIGCSPYVFATTFPTNHSRRPKRESGGMNSLHQ